MSDEEHPLAAILASLIGGALIVIDGVRVASAASIISSTASVGSPISRAARRVEALGALSAFLGFAVLLRAIGLYLWPEAHVGLGIALLILSFLSLVGGGGFIPGLFLGLVGGILAIVFQPSEEELPAGGLGSTPARPPGGWEVAAWGTCPSCNSSLAPGTKVCERCGARFPALLNPTPSAQGVERGATGRPPPVRRSGVRREPARPLINSRGWERAPT